MRRRFEAVSLRRRGSGGVTDDPSRAGVGCRLQIIGLFLIFAATAGFAIWQASNQPTPTIFTDEIEMTQLARSIIDTGHASLPRAARALAPLGGLSQRAVLADRQRLDRLRAVKVLGAIMMAIGGVPGLWPGPARRAARLGAVRRCGDRPLTGTRLRARSSSRSQPRTRSRRWRCSSSRGGRRCRTRWSARARARRLCRSDTWRRISWPRSSPSSGAAARITGVSGRSARAFRATWSREPTGSAPLSWSSALVIVAGAYLDHRSTSWYVSTAFFQDRMLDYGLWAVGALTIGLGIVPLIAGLASLVRPRDEEREARRAGARDRDVGSARSLRRLHGHQGRVPVDRLRDAHARAEPHLPRALSSSPGRHCSSSAAAAVPGLSSQPACFALYLVRGPPTRSTQYPNYEAHGLAIAALANRIFRWPTSTIEHTLTADDYPRRSSLLVLALRGSAAARGNHPRRSAARS